MLLSLDWPSIIYLFILYRNQRIYWSDGYFSNSELDYFDGLVQDRSISIANTGVTAVLHWAIDLITVPFIAFLNMTQMIIMYYDRKALSCEI